jgi:pimeloyl-ACP methyl ester carboxylesterase
LLVTIANSADHVVRLHGGRQLSYAEYGDPSGFPVVSAHGGLACRLDVAAAAGVAHNTGVRLISPDRPGVGRSDAQHGRTILGWARDVEELLDQLGVERFAAMGWSLGGQYAAAVGYALWPRVTRVAIIAGALPLTEPGVFECLPAVDRFFCRISQRAPWVARQCFRVMRIGVGCAPTLYGRLAARDLGAADAAVIREEGYASFSRMCHEALRQPGGMAEEYRVMTAPWEFAPEDLEVPADVWGGTEDQYVPAAWPAELARRIPDAVLHMRPGGHFLAHLYYREIFDALRAR